MEAKKKDHKIFLVDADRMTFKNTLFLFLEK